MNRTKQVLLSTIFLYLYTGLFAQAPKSYTSSELMLQLKKLNTVGSVLYIAAHPDDENTRLIAYLANEKCLRTGYLSLTRGDGGQNLIGPEQGVELGVIRTNELLAARRIDGGEQYFTRAYDFGYSKSPEETFTKWNKDSVLHDVVYVIRKFRPDIIITRFATDGSGGHGHHTASAILAEEAFDAAGDPSRFPEQLAYVSVWQPRRLFWNVSTRFQNPNADMSIYLKLDVGGYNALLGKSYGEMAAESRSMHRSQGFGSARQRGEYFEYFMPIKGDTAALNDIFDRMNFSWMGISEGKLVATKIAKIIKTYNMQQPDACANELLKLIPEITKLARKNVSLAYYAKLAKSIADASRGMVDECVANGYHFAESAPIQLQRQQISRTATNSGNIQKEDFGIKADTYTPLFWIEKPMIENFFQYDFYSKLEDETRAPLLHKVPSGEDIAVQYKFVDPSRGELYRPVVITPPILLRMDTRAMLFRTGEAKKIIVTLNAMTDNINCNVLATVPDGWNIDYLNKSQNGKSAAFVNDIELKKANDVFELIFYVWPTDSSKSGLFNCKAIIGNKEYSLGMKEIKYDHIPVQSVFTDASARLTKLDVIRHKKLIGYIPGAGDDVSTCLIELGYEVVILTNEKLASDDLNKYDAIVTGVRAYNVNQELPKFKKRLMDYVEAGGNLIVQYNTNSWAGPLNSDIGPYPFKITRNRIASENSKVLFVIPEHPVLNYPNKISQKDFDDWVQERSIYHAGEWDVRYDPIITMADPYEKLDAGGLITTKYGKGNFVYTGLVFFRQLPAGVPGAYRLFVNLIEQK
jgi:LmbE family N-acetylglucosaminyl deacetylase